MDNHEYCINGVDLQKYLIEQLQMARDKVSRLGPKTNPVGHAYLNSEVNILERLAHFVGKMLKEIQDKGAVDMAELKKGLVVQTVNLEDLPLRRTPRALEEEMMETIKNLKVGKGAIIDEQFIKYRSLAAYISRLRRNGKLEDMDVRVRKDDKGRVILARYK